MIINLEGLTLTELEFNEKGVPINIEGKGLYYMLDDFPSYEGEIEGVDEKDESISIKGFNLVVDYRGGLNCGNIPAYKIGPVINQEKSE